MPRHIGRFPGDSQGLRPREEPRESFDVRFWKIRVYKGKRGSTYAVRWTVGGKEHHRPALRPPVIERRPLDLQTYPQAQPREVEAARRLVRAALRRRHAAYREEIRPTLGP